MSAKQREVIEYADNIFNRKPVKEPFNTKFKRFLFNPEDGAIFGRTPSSWGKPLHLCTVLSETNVKKFNLIILKMNK